MTAMDKMQHKVCLASASPRRQQLLQQVGIDFEVMVPEIDETPHDNEDAETFVVRIAREKAEQVAARRISGNMPQLPVLAADTAVVLDNRILGKPRDRQDAIAMLTDLAGRTHVVLTAVTILYKDRADSLVQKSEVKFAPLNRQQIEAYWQTGEPADKAGAYGIQGRAAAFISHLQGSYTGVMGLPLFETCQMLERIAANQE